MSESTHEAPPRSLYRTQADGELVRKSVWPEGEEAANELAEAIKWAMFDQTPELDDFPEIAAAALRRLREVQP